jgi:hypothetical protein
MNEKIHELRTRIDGLAQLVKSFQKPLFIKQEYIPADKTIDDVFDEYLKTGVIIMSGVYKIPFFDNSCIGECHKSLLLAKAWLGKALAELGEETPYKNDGNRKIIEDIEPTYDSKDLGYLFSGVGQKFWYDKTYIEKIDWLREEIQKLINPIIRYTNEEEWIGLFITKTYEYLTEARFFFGFELQRLKEQSN